MPLVNPGASPAIPGVTTLASVTVYSDVRALGAGQFPVVEVLGGSTAGDGQDGFFYWNSTSVAADDGFATLAPNAGGTGRWIRICGSFKQSGSTFSRPVSGKLGDVISVKDFGALGDGTTNDSNAFANAKTYGLASGRALYVPSGTYMLDAQSFTGGQNNLMIFGEGPENSILKYRGSSGSDFITMTGCGYWTIRDIGIDGNSNAKIGLNVTDDSGATAGTTQNCLFENLHIKNCLDNTGCGLFVGVPTASGYQVSENDFRSIWFFDCKHGVIVDGAQTIGNKFDRLNFVISIAGAQSGNHIYIKQGFNNKFRDVWGSGNNSTIAKFDRTNNNLYVIFENFYVESNATVFSWSSDANSAGACIYDFSNINIRYSGTAGSKIIEVLHGATIKFSGAIIGVSSGAGDIYIASAGDGSGFYAVLKEDDLYVGSGISRNYSVSTQWSSTRPALESGVVPLEFYSGQGAGLTTPMIRLRRRNFSSRNRLAWYNDALTADEGYLASSHGVNNAIAMLDASGNEIAAWTASKGLYATGRISVGQGATVASANNLALGTDGNRFQISGTTQINLIDNSNWQGGSIVTLHFQGNVTVKHNQAASGNNKPIMLSAAGDFSATANDQLTLQYDSTDSKWYEVWRVVI